MTVRDPPRRDGPTIDPRAARYVAWSQIGFAFFLAICVALHPGLVLKVNEGGMSNYGVHAKTAVPYTLALVSAAGLTYWAARLIPVTTSLARQFRTLLHTYSGLILLTLVTTYGYTLNAPLKYVHVAVGVATIVFESVASIWLYRTVRRLGAVLFVQLLGLVLAALTFFGALHVLFLSQILTGGAFAILLVLTCRRVAPPLEEF
ncbi:MAG TPA: hypothetical protein VNF08_06840 [Acidimicrobiales bacterium]|nr:hypothetical protein [Acidimicrobiales bacterium]